MVASERLSVTGRQMEVLRGTPQPSPTAASSDRRERAERQAPTPPPAAKVQGSHTAALAEQAGAGPAPQQRVEPRPAATEVLAPQAEPGDERRWGAQLSNAGLSGEGLPEGIDAGDAAWLMPETLPLELLDQEPAAAPNVTPEPPAQELPAEHRKAKEEEPLADAQRVSLTRPAPDKPRPVRRTGPGRGRSGGRRR